MSFSYSPDLLFVFGRGRPFVPRTVIGLPKPKVAGEPLVPNTGFCRYFWYLSWTDSGIAFARGRAWSFCSPLRFFSALHSCLSCSP